MAPEVDNDSFHDKNNESVTIDLNTVETKVGETSADRKYELSYDVLRAVIFCTFLCLDLAIAHGLQSLVGTDTGDVVRLHGPLQYKWPYSHMGRHVVYSMYCSPVQL